MIERLVAAGADILATDAKGRTAMHHAAKRAHESTIYALDRLDFLYRKKNVHRNCKEHTVCQRPLNVHVREGEGKTPLHMILEQPMTKYNVAYRARLSAVSTICV